MLAGRRTRTTNPRSLTSLLELVVEAGHHDDRVAVGHLVFLGGVVDHPHALAESFTWAATSLLAGVSFGIAAGGLVLEHSTPSSALLLGAAATLVGLLIAWIGICARAP